jgi:sugar phosphate isomerase/epimerase
MLGQIVAYVGDQQRAEELYTLMEPCARLHAMCADAAIYIDPFARILGLLGTTLERWDEAQAYFEMAVTQTRAMGASPRLARTQYDYARMLMTRERHGDRDHAFELLDHAAETARRLGLKLLEAHVERALTGNARRTTRRPNRDTARIARQGEYWTIVFRDSELRLKDSKGVRYLDTLLRHPHTVFHALVLAADEVAASAHSPMALASDSGPILDRQARRAYGARLEALRVELTDAERLADLGRAERVRAEIDQLSAELESAISPTGVTRRWSSPAERARLSVTKAIRATQKKVLAACPELGQHLANCIKTGQTCSYEPEPGGEIEWQH